jgi:hypothetical protein
MVAGKDLKEIDCTGCGRETGDYKNNNSDTVHKIMKILP